MWDKKNNVLFTETECLVLSPDFKLLDESQVLLKVARQNNMYSFDLKNVVPSGGLTCLIAKATFDESNLCHRRLGHINFKTMNKLVRGNLVRGIKREFSVARTPKQNGVAKRKNRSLIEAARTMPADSLLPTIFWAEAVNAACYIQNRVLVTKPHNKRPYELLLGRPPSISFIRPFGCPVTILNTLDPLGTFDRKADEGFLVGYSINSKAFRVFNTRTRKVEENLHINYLKNKPNVVRSGPEWLFNIDSLTKSMNYEPVTAGNQTNSNAGIETNVNAGQAGQKKASDNEYILLPLMLSNSYLFLSSQSIDNKDADEVRGKGNDDLSKRNDQERIDSSTKDVNTVGPSINTASENINIGSPNINTTSPFPNDSSMQSLENTGIFDDAYEDREVGAEYELNNLKTTMNVNPITTTRIHKDHLKDQIIGDINSTNQTRRMTKISKEHVMFPDKVYKVEKALYGLHQAPRAWYETLPTYLLENRYRKGTIDKTLFIKKDRSDILLVQVYVDDIIFGSAKNQDKYVVDILKTFNFVTVKIASTPMEPNKALVKDEEAEDVDVHLYRSMIGSLMYLTARHDITFVVCACARFQVTPKISHLHAVKRIFRYLKGQPKLGLWYPMDSPFDLEAFSDSGASLDRKSTTRGCQFLGKRLISLQCKKQTIVANSTTEAEYVAAGNCYGQVLWIQNQMLDY
ncbi:putative ribonuclease H-like domain-containing protein, partial [Tanacetum coccineum]